MKKSDVTSLGSLMTAVVASLCCIGPVAVALIGVGSIGVFSVFETYRPYLIGVTVILLGLAFYLTYRKREVMCEDGTCKVESAGKWNKISVWFAAMIAAVAIAFPYLELTPTASAQSTPPQIISKVLPAVAILKVDGMDCKACAAGLQATLGRIDGVTKASVAFDDGKAVLEYDPSKVQLQKFIDQVDKVGFKATLVESNSANDSTQQIKQSSISEVVLDIEGMDCKACAKGLEVTLGRVEGVKNAKVDFDKGKARLQYDSKITEPRKLTDKVDEVGFKAKLNEGNSSK